MLRPLIVIVNENKENDTSYITGQTQFKPRNRYYRDVIAGWERKKFHLWYYGTIWKDQVAGK